MHYPSTEILVNKNATNEFGEKLNVERSFITILISRGRSQLFI